MAKLISIRSILVALKQHALEVEHQRKCHLSSAAPGPVALDSWRRLLGLRSLSCQIASLVGTH